MDTHGKRSRILSIHNARNILNRTSSIKSTQQATGMDNTMGTVSCNSYQIPSRIRVRHLWTKDCTVLLWISMYCLLQLQVVLASDGDHQVQVPGARDVIYSRHITVQDGGTRDCSRPQIIPSRSPSRESIYTCCEGWKLEKNSCIPDDECFTMRLGQDYRGFINKTQLGHICVPWLSGKITPHLNDSMTLTPVVNHALSVSSNNCRNPWSDRQRPWCFVEPRPGVVDWEYCAVGKPRKTCNMAKNYRVKCGQFTCDHGQVCDETTQTCGCRVGYQGPRCDEKCDDGHFGSNCHGICECSDQEHCDHVTGDCNSSEDDNENNERTVINNRSEPLAPRNGTAAMCRASCGVLSKIGCTCTPDGGACKCPGYVIALFVVSIATWLTLGSVCVVCTVKRRRYAAKIEYKRDSDYCEDLESDEETELANNVSQPTTATTTTDISTSQMNHQGLSESSSHPLPPLPSTSPPSSPSPSIPPSKPKIDITKATPNSKSDNKSSESPATEKNNQQNFESSTSSSESHLYLNVDRESSLYSIDYSHPYDFLNSNGENCFLNGNNLTQISPEQLLLHYMVHQQQIRAINNAKHGYVNDSVAKWQERKISKRLFPFGHSAMPCNNMSASTGQSPGCGRQESRDILQLALRRGKPTIKPKPDVLKLLGNAKTKRGPHERLLENSEHLDSIGEHERLTMKGCPAVKISECKDNNGTRNDSSTRFLSCQHLRPVAQYRGGSVPSPTLLKGREGGEELTVFSFSEDHIYENSQIGKPCVRTGKSRSTDLFNHF